MKRYVALLITVLLLFMCLFSLGCDRRGFLSEREKQELYDEIEGLIRSGEIWDYEAEPWLSSAWETDYQAHKSIEILKSAANAAYDSEAGNSIGGYWAESKTSWRVLNVELNNFSLPGDDREGVRYIFSAAKNKDGTILLSVSDIEPGSDTWKPVTEVAFHKD